MKRIIFLFLLLLLNNASPAKVIITDELGRNLYKTIRRYYYMNLKYPETVDELFKVIWHNVNQRNDNRFKSFDELLVADDVRQFYFVGGYELLFLTEYRDEIEINVDGDFFQLKFRDYEIEMENNYCENLSLNIDENYYIRAGRFFVYDLENYLIPTPYVDELFLLLPKISRKYTDCYINKVDSLPLCFLLKYNKEEEKIQSMCNEEDIDFENNEFLKELHFALDTFTANREEIHSIMFIERLYYNK